MKIARNLSKADKKMLRSVFWRSWTLNAIRTGATQYHALGFIYTLLPVINRYYKTPKTKSAAIVRHMTWFNATTHINNFIVGLVAAMEHQNSEDPNFDPNSITAVKASLMGLFPELVTPSFGRSCLLGDLAGNCDWNSHLFSKYRIRYGHHFVFAFI